MVQLVCTEGMRHFDFPSPSSASFLTVSEPVAFTKSVSPPSPVSEFLQRPLDVHSVTHARHSQVQEVVLG